MKYLFTLVLIVLIAQCSNNSAPLTRREEGAVVGGALGAGGGAVIGNQFGSTAGGAAIGAATGALSGAVVGEAQTDRQALVKSQEEILKRFFF